MKMKKAFQNPLTLAPYNPDKEIEGLIDASDLGLAFITFQMGNDEKYHIIGCVSTGLRGTQVH